MHKLVVHYGNGETENIEPRNNFSAGSESRVIDLPGNKRVIQKIVFWYDTKNLARGNAECGMRNAEWRQIIPHSVFCIPHLTTLRNNLYPAATTRDQHRPRPVCRL